RTFAAAADVGWAAVSPAGHAIFEAEAQLDGHDEPVPLPPDPASEQFLVPERSVNLRGVAEANSQLARPMDGCERFRLVGFAVHVDAAPGHRHAAEPEGGNAKVVSQISMFHDHSSRSLSCSDVASPGSYPLRLAAVAVAATSQVTLPRVRK